MFSGFMSLRVTPPRILPVDDVMTVQIRDAQNHLRRVETRSLLRKMVALRDREDKPLPAANGRRADRRR